jgi:hypothetical protein
MKARTIITSLFLSLFLIIICTGCSAESESNSVSENDWKIVKSAQDGSRLELSAKLIHLSDNMIQIYHQDENEVQIEIRALLISTERRWFSGQYQFSGVGFVMVYPLELNKKKEGCYIGEEGHYRNDRDGYFQISKVGVDCIPG